MRIAYVLNPATANGPQNPMPEPLARIVARLLRLDYWPTRQHSPISGACHTLDQIITWDEVREGDLVLNDGELELVARILDPEDEPKRRTVFFDGYPLPSFPLRTSYAAVARYLVPSA